MACSSSRGLCSWMTLNDTANRLLDRKATSKGLGSKAMSHSILNDQVAVGCQPFWADPIRHSDLRTHTETWSDGLIPRQFAPSSPSNKRWLPFVDSMLAVQAAQKHQAYELVKHTNLVTQGLAISLPVPCTSQRRCHASSKAYRMYDDNSQESNRKSNRKLEQHTLANAEATTILRLCDACRPLCPCKSPQSACANKVTFWQRNLANWKALFSRPWAKPWHASITFQVQIRSGILVYQTLFSWTVSALLLFN